MLLKHDRCTKNNKNFVHYFALSRFVVSFCRDSLQSRFVVLSSRGAFPSCYLPIVMPFNNQSPHR
ncbi:hypothetical protein EI546_02490 [Aequorivita sp. H23M31]|uniref:Uncharacterized protein n=1 Tax=Aequorivita ciconiae TaxID=2494375 RepID=A0A410G074_9FLAO|nr:hypothetical protein EI546_02490 [Aequorivita sp. H23M31]